MSTSLAVPAKNGPEKSEQVRKGLYGLTPEQISDYDEAKMACARALGQGFSAKQVAKALGKRLIPQSPHTDVVKIERQAYHKIKRMQAQPEFRDLIYHEAVVTLDLKAPLILGGVAQAAMRGRVDAARLALEITGRHTKDDAPITQVQVVLNNIPRPERAE